MKFRFRKRMVIGAVVCGLILLAAGYFMARPKLPKYQGKDVYAWLQEAMAVKHLPYDAVQWQRIDEAFDAMGPAAMPHILAWLKDDAGDRPMVRKLKIKLNSLPLAATHFPVYGPGVRAEAALRLLEFRGRKAIGARERLEELLLFKTKDPYIQKRYYADFLQVIGVMGTAASNSSPVVAQVFVSTNRWLRGLAVDVFAAITPRESSAIGLLQSAIRNGDVPAAKGVMALARLRAPYREFIPNLTREVSSNSYDALNITRRLKLQEEIFVPAAAALLAQPNPTNRASFLKELGRLGPRARPAVPEITKALTNEVPIVREAAERALESIAPEILPSIGPASDLAGEEKANRGGIASEQAEP